MAIYYVDTAADNGGDGTTTALTGSHCAWNQVSDVNSASLSAGDFVYFKRGCTFTDATLVIDSGGSSAGTRLTFGAYGAGNKPIITEVDDSCILCTSSSCDYITVENIKCQGGVLGFISASRYDIIIDSCDVDSAAGNGIFLTRINGFTVNNCTVTNSTNGGIIIYGQTGQAFGICNGTITDNTVSGCGSDGINVHTADDGTTHPGDNFVFHGNNVTNCGEQCYDIGRDDGVGIDNVTFENNTISNGTGTIGAIMAIKNSVVRYNRFYSNVRTSLSLVRSCDEVDIYYNTFSDDVRESITFTDTVGATVTDIRIYNNTFTPGDSHDTGYAFILINPQVNRITIKNNIVVTNATRFFEYSSTATPENTTTVSDYNCFYSAAGDAKFGNIGGSDHTFAQWQSGHGQDLHSLWDDPEFVSSTDFHLQATSPCINAGTPVGLTEDIEGNPIG